MYWIVRVLLLGLLVILSGCDKGPQDQRQTLLVFGTLLDIQAYTDQPELFNEAVRELDKTFQKMHREWHAWQGEGELVRLNRALADGEALQVSAELGSLLQQARQYAIDSEHLFNPAIGQFDRPVGVSQRSASRRAAAAEGRDRGLAEAQSQHGGCQYSGTSGQ